MEKEKVKELIEQYFDDGFDYVEIETIDDCIPIAKTTKLDFIKNQLVIVNYEYAYIIPYVNILAIYI